MRKTFTVLISIAIGILLTTSVFAQTSEKMSYQAVIRNSSDALVVNTQVGMQISILQGSESETVVYTETQTLSDVILNNNSANDQIKNITDPADAQDAATKAYVDELRIMILDLQAELGVTDSRDGTHYDVLRIGNQVWMAENLKYLPSVVGPTTGSATLPYYYVYGYNGTVVADAKATANFTTYSVLYNWPAAMNGAASSTVNPSGVQGVCPTDWHLPSDAEWTELTDYLGGTSVAGGKLKELGTTHWTTPNTGATNETGFTALPSGFRSCCGVFYSNSIGSYGGSWWSATESGALDAGGRSVHYDSSRVGRHFGEKEEGFSVRCVRD